MMEYQTTGWLSPKLKQLEAENARLLKEVERLIQVPMKYRRMAFNAELQESNARLREELAAAQAVIEQMREKLTSCRSSIRQDLTNYERVLDDMDRSDQQHKSAYNAVSKERTRLFRLLNYIDSLDSATISLDALHEARALECERLKVICEEGFSEFLPNTGGQYALKCMSDILSQEAAAHRARKEGK